MYRYFCFSSVFVGKSVIRNGVGRREVTDWMTGETGKVTIASLSALKNKKQRHCLLKGWHHVNQSTFEREKGNY